MSPTEREVVPNEPLVSIVLRTKDRPVLLRRALGSVTAQTAGCWRIVLVDDADTPDAVDHALADAQLANDQRVMVVRAGRPLGRPGAINAGLDAVTTAYWAIHDDDDHWAPDFLERTLERMESEPDLGAVVTRTAVVFERAVGGDYVELRRAILAPDIHQATFLEIAGRNKFPPISMLVRTGVLDSVGRIDESLLLQEDWDFYLRLFSRFPIGFIDGEPLAFWHHRETDNAADANSITDSDGHAGYEQVVRDRYLRGELAAGRTSVGEVMAMAGLIADLRAEMGELRAAVAQLTKAQRRGNRAVERLGESIEGGRLAPRLRRRLGRRTDNVS